MEQEERGEEMAHTQLEKISDTPFGAQQLSMYSSRKNFSFIWPLIQHKDHIEQDAFLSDGVTNVLNC